MEKLFADFYVVYVYTLATISIMLNIFLTAVIYLSPNKAGKYRMYTVSFVVANLLFSFSCAIAMPYWYQYPQLCTLFSVSPLNISPSLQERVMDVWWSVVLGVLILASASFIHRHAVVCNSIFKPYFTSKYAILTIILIPVLSFLYTYEGTRILRRETSSLRIRMGSELGTTLNIDFQTTHLVAIDFEEIRNSTYLSICFAILVVTMAILFLGIIYCGLDIDRTIKKVTYSKNLKKKHLKALQILILQTANPFVFVYGPFILLFTASIIGLDWHFPEKFSDILIHLFPIINAMIILTMTDEYINTVTKRARSSGSNPSMNHSKMVVMVQVCRI